MIIFRLLVEERRMIPFSYAVVDDEGEVIRKYRWSVKEAKWFTEKNPHVKVIRLDQEPKQTATQIQQELFNLVGEATY
jgi:hypothetical protein